MTKSTKLIEKRETRTYDQTKRNRKHVTGAHIKQLQELSPQQQAIAMSVGQPFWLNRMREASRQRMVKREDDGKDHPLPGKIEVIQGVSPQQYAVAQSVGKPAWFNRMRIENRQRMIERGQL